MSFGFQVLERHGHSRTGLLSTPHGEVPTPAFMPVATRGAVKGISPAALRGTGADIVLSNLYHLTVRPGIDIVERLGGLHEFIGWSGPLLADSGGFQVFSLASLRRVDDGGVTFRSHLDGQELRLTPGGVIESQRRLGVDVAMVLDECPPWPVSRERAEISLRRTHRWAAASREAWEKRPGPGGLFGIVQGSTFRDLRERAAEDLVTLGFHGFAIGGVSVGEPERERRDGVEWTLPLLPSDRPRYLMGVGYPADILHAVSWGVDLFDCVLPTRNARHGILFTSEGILRIKNARFKEDPGPLDPACSCLVCRDASRALLHHLARYEPLTGKVLATLHNLHFYLDFMNQVRQAIAAEALAELSDRHGEASAASSPDQGRRAAT